MLQRFLYTIAVVLILVYAPTQAQPEYVEEQTLPVLKGSSLEGKKFLIGFMQNELAYDGSSSDLRLYVSSRSDAKVTLSGPSVPTTQFDVKANTVSEISIAPYFEVNISHIITSRGIFIESDVPVLVYGFSTRKTTTEAFTAIPIEHLGTEYRVVTQGTDYYAPTLNDPEILPRSAEFMFIAVEDSTTVTYIPNTNTLADQPFEIKSIVLQAGECYLVQSQQSVLIGSRDLTGSRVTSTKPIVLLSGHVRAGIPNKTSNSKDHLIEMLPPIPKWRKHYISSPFAKVVAPHYVRLVASEDNTSINVNQGGALGYTFTLDYAGNFKDVELLDAAEFQATKPFLAVQLMPSNIYRDANNFYDPAMVVLPGVDQYVESTILQFPELIQQYSDRIKIPQFYYVNLIADTIAIQTLVINGLPIENYDPGFKTRFTPNLGFVYGAIQLPLGQHYIGADSGYFSGIMYGLSSNDSYANQLGVNYSEKTYRERTPPKYTLSAECGTIRGTIVDVGVDSVQLDTVEVVTSVTKNVTWQMSDVDTSLNTVVFNADVTDLTKDATLTVRSYDAWGNGKEWKYNYDAPNLSFPREIVLSLFNSKNCVRVPIINRDTSATIIRNIRCSAPLELLFSDTAISNFTLKAKDTLWVTVCAELADSLLQGAVVIVELPCGLFERIPIRIQLVRNLEASGKDFGKVRLFDTICSKVPIVNTGKVPVTLTRLVLQTSLPQFTVDERLLVFPKVLRPNDTLWLDVCFVPTDEVLYARTDTIISKEGIVVLYQLIGSGIRPRFTNIVVDWGKTRVGIRQDSTFRIRNSGTGSAVVSLATFIGDTAQFIEPVLRNASILENGAFSTVSASYYPQLRGVHADSSTLDIDWKYHEPVQILFKGVGVLPDIITTDVDFGEVLVGDNKDTLATMVQSAGDDSLIIYTIEKTGPDVVEFSIPESVTSTPGLSSLQSITDIVQFSPTRVGQHICSVRVTNNSAFGDKPVDSWFVLYGKGYRNDSARVETTLRVPERVLACTDFPIVLTISNPSTVACKIETVTIEVDGVPLYKASIGKGLQASESFTIEIATSVSLTATGLITSNVTASTKQLLTHVASIEIDPVRAQMEVTSDVFGTPGDNAVLKCAVHVNDTLTYPLEYQVTLQVPTERMRIDSVKCREVEQRGNQSVAVERSVGFSQSATELNVSPDAPTNTPATLEFDVFGTLLWKNTLEQKLVWTITGMPCLADVSDFTRLQVETCADNLRSVILSGFLNVNVPQFPSVGAIDCNIEASSTTKVSVKLLGLFGQVFLQEREILLEKGIKHVTFTCSGIPSGLYRLVVIHEHGQQGVPVMFVN